jgi:hypothetical protein
MVTSSILLGLRLHMSPHLYPEQLMMRVNLPFTRWEKYSLWALVVAFIVPFNTLGGKFFIATEIAMIAFVAAAHWRVNNLSRPLPLLIVLGVPLVFAFRFPSSGFSLMVGGLVYVKMVVFVYFIYILIKRCHNIMNVTWLAKRIVLPIALVLCLSAIIDRYTELQFFAEWHQIITASTLSSRIDSSYFLDPERWEQFAGISQKAGFATRPSDIPPWALLGLAAGYWLWQSGQMRRTTFIGIFFILLAAAFSMPKRSSVITIGVAFLAFLLLARSRAERRRKVPIFILLIGFALAIDWFAQTYQIVFLGWDPSTAAYFSSISRLMASGITGKGLGGLGLDMRYQMLGLEIEWFLSNPRELFLGTGWNLTGGLWSKPHNTYIALITGGGILSLIAVTIAVIYLFRRPMAEGGQETLNFIGVVLFIALCVEIGINGYLFHRLEFPASTLVIWVAWSVIMYRVLPWNTFYRYGYERRKS